MFLMLLLFILLRGQRMVSERLVSEFANRSLDWIRQGFSHRQFCNSIYLQNRTFLIP